jgi:NitT/TauT family transport system substrate-binding protein
MGDGLAAVERGDVDAAYLAEPFTSKARKSGFPVISSPVYETAPEGATSGYFTVQPYLEGHGDIVDAFARAMAKSVEYANSHPDKVHAQIAEYTGLDAAAIEGMIIPTFTAELTQSGLDTMIGQLQDQGWLDTVPDAASMVRE